VPSLVAKARATNDEFASHPSFQNRVNEFLKLKQTDWMDWAKKSVTEIASLTVRLAKIANDVSLAQAPKWTDELREAYKGSGRSGGWSTWFGGSHKGPEFYQGMLENAKAILVRGASTLQDLKDELSDSLPALGVDLLVLDVCTSDVHDPMGKQIADGRKRAIVTAISSAQGLSASVDSASLSFMQQAIDVDQLLTGIIPGWIAAQSKG
jgi:hypothetical protein